ncbi:alpha/beta fold hydrolase [Qipengyuania sp. JC766]|uniref:alpha/beta fold hydrolase n=1 Tax=Qipengyuania sp. JC766 TaxID=3232139 RepID=UPI0034587327
MPRTTANDIELEYEEYGDPADPAMLLIMGFGAQLTLWPMALVDALVAHGFRVIRYDNRDVGLSQKFTGHRPPSPVKQVLLGKIGLRPKVPYTMADMAADGVGLLDALGIERAHIVGGSMGGMIAQHIAAKYPGRCLSLTSIFSTTGNPKLPAARKEALDALTKRPDSTEEDVLVAHGMMLARTIGSPGYPAEEDELRDRVTANVRRSVYAEGPTRHLAAVLHDGDRSAMLRDITVPTLVLHGEADPLVPVEGGHDTAAIIPGAKLKTIPGWGHDLPEPLTHEIADAIAAHAKGAA